MLFYLDGHTFTFLQRGLDWELLFGGRGSTVSGGTACLGGGCYTLEFLDLNTAFEKLDDVFDSLTLLR